jgi:hypothetical protein
MVASLKRLTKLMKRDTEDKLAITEVDENIYQNFSR